MASAQMDIYIFLQEKLADHPEEQARFDLRQNTKYPYFTRVFITCLSLEFCRSLRRTRRRQFATRDGYLCVRYTQHRPPAPGCRLYSTRPRPFRCQRRRWGRPRLPTSAALSPELRRDLLPTRPNLKSARCNPHDRARIAHLYPHRKRLYTRRTGSRYN